tara:strand:+ start:120 stop:467 length:348 start_codon:yes stop_codon:yes gene_type:complete
MANIDSLGAYGAEYYRSGSIRVTGSFSALQGLVDHGLAVPGQNTLTGSYTQFQSITWGRADAAGTNNFTSSKAHSIRIGPGDIIHGPIYAFNLLTGSCLAYLSKQGGDTNIGGHQ